MKSHTPGPWTVLTNWPRQTGLNGLWIYRTGPNGEPLTTVVDTTALDAFPLSEANANLIATAPDLLAACDAAYHCHVFDIQRGVGVSELEAKMLAVRDQLEAAIAKARGGTA